MRLSSDRHGDGVSAEPARGRRFLRWLLPRAAVVLVAVLTLRISGCMERLFYHPSAGPTPAASHMEDVWFESRDGTRLYGWWIPARGRAPGDPPAPTILHLHGNAGNIADHEWFTQHLPPAGFNVFLFDYRGYGQSASGRLSRAKILDDAQGALDAILSREDVDPARIGLYGQSLGGAVGIVLMAERREIRAAVFESPFASWRGVAACVIGGDPPGPLARLAAAMLLSDSHNPLEAICRIDRPVLLLHGEADEIVPASHSKSLADANPTCCQVVIYAGGAHNSLKDTHPEMAEAMVEFLERHLSQE